MNMMRVVADDAAVLKDLAKGDTAGLGVLYDRHGAHLFKIALRILRNRVEAEDVVHDVFVSLPERSRQYRDSVGAVRTWLSAVTRNECIDRVRRARRRAASNAILAAGEASTSMCEPELMKTVSRLADAFGGLTEQEKRILVASFSEDLTYSQIAETDGIPLGTIKSRAARALAKLRATANATPVVPAVAELAASRRPYAKSRRAAKRVSRKTERPSGFYQRSASTAQTVSSMDLAG
jgi:RNA polymerase sigma-70 factor (ECF subfamily)